MQSAKKYTFRPVKTRRKTCNDVKMFALKEGMRSGFI